MVPDPDREPEFRTLMLMDKEGIHIPKMCNQPHKLFEPITLLFIEDCAVCFELRSNAGPVLPK